MVIHFQTPVDRADPPHASVLMALYNEQPEFLEQAVRSVLAQTFSDFEFLILDDGSTSADSLVALAALTALDSRIRLVHRSHVGLTKTLNAGLALCRAPLVFRHDSDDWSDPHRFAAQAAFLAEHPEIGLVGSFVWQHQENGAPLWVGELPRWLPPGPAVHATFQADIPFCHGAICFRRRLAETIGGYREQFSCTQDYDFTWRFCERFGGANLPIPLYHYRRTVGSISGQRSHEQRLTCAMIRCLGKMRAQGVGEDFSAARREAANSVDASPYQAAAKRADRMLLAGRHREALATLGRAIAAAPWRLSGYLRLVRMLLFLLAPGLRPRLFGFRPAFQATSRSRHPWGSISFSSSARPREVLQSLLQEEKGATREIA